MHPEPAAAPHTTWQARLAAILETMRDMSRQTDPQAMVRSYGARMQSILPRDRLLALSRRTCTFPEYRITRNSDRAEDINPWKQPERLPRLRGGLLAELIYSNEPCIIDHLDLPDSDPAAPYVAGQRSLLAIPLFDHGEALNMVIVLRREPAAFGPEDLPDQVLISNLFGRATSNLVLSDQLRQAYAAVDRELQAVASIQRSLLPEELPKIPSLDLAAHYETSRRAGGDYYDLFPLPHNQWGILMADVSGHGTPAAVMMAITHALAHTHPELPAPPARLLTRLNAQLTEHYTRGQGTFITAFYGIYDPTRRTLRYSSAGHPAPRLKRCSDGSLVMLDGAPGLPLGVIAEAEYVEMERELRVGDQIIFYTDGITEAFNSHGEMFGVERLDEVLTNCSLTAQGLLSAVIESVNRFTNGHPMDDDRTVLIARCVTGPTDR